MKIGIDLLWVRVGKCGGTESFIRNLLSGFSKYDKENEYVLFAAKDNAESFEKYERDSKNIRIVKCPTKSESRVGRILWENLYLDNAAKREGVDLMYIPVYSMPRRRKKNNIPYVVTIHDLQGWHYPEYFSKPRLFFLKRKWKYAVDNAEIIVATSEYVRGDIERHYSEVREKCEVIPIPLILKDVADDKEVLDKYGVQKGKYFYTVSSLLPHKNLDTILKMLKYREKSGYKDEKLVISGVGGAEAIIKDFKRRLSELDIEKLVVSTGFISDEERNALYKNCKAFLYPSIFEGFGMPPVEALIMGAKVVTTDRTSIKEVTEGRAEYVADPFDEVCWSESVERISVESRSNKETRSISFPRLQQDSIVSKYKEIFKRIVTE